MVCLVREKSVSHWVIFEVGVLELLIRFIQGAEGAGGQGELADDAPELAGLQFLAIQAHHPDWIRGDRTCMVIKPEKLGTLAKVGWSPPGEHVPSNPGTGLPVLWGGGSRELPRPTQVAVMAWAVSVCHQWFKVGT